MDGPARTTSSIGRHTPRCVCPHSADIGRWPGRALCSSRSCPACGGVCVLAARLLTGHAQGSGRSRPGLILWRRRFGTDVITHRPPAGVQTLFFFRDICRRDGCAPVRSGIGGIRRRHGGGGSCGSTRCGCARCLRRGSRGCACNASCRSAGITTRPPGRRRARTSGGCTGSLGRSPGNGTRCAGGFLPASAAAAILDADLHQLEAPVRRASEGQTPAPFHGRIGPLGGCHRSLQEDAHAGIEQELFLGKTIRRLGRTASRRFQAGRSLPATGHQLRGLADRSTGIGCLRQEIGGTGNLRARCGRLRIGQQRQPRQRNQGQ